MHVAGAGTVGMADTGGRTRSGRRDESPTAGREGGFTLCIKPCWMGWP